MATATEAPILTASQDSVAEAPPQRQGSRPQSVSPRPASQADRWEELKTKAVEALKLKDPANMAAKAHQLAQLKELSGKLNVATSEAQVALARLQSAEERQSTLLAADKAKLAEVEAAIAACEKNVGILKDSKTTLSEVLTESEEATRVALERLRCKLEEKLRSEMRKTQCINTVSYGSDDDYYNTPEGQEYLARREKELAAAMAQQDEMGLDDAQRVVDLLGCDELKCQLKRCQNLELASKWIGEQSIPSDCTTSFAAVERRYLQLDSIATRLLDVFPQGHPMRCTLEDLQMVAGAEARAARRQGLTAGEEADMLSDLLGKIRAQEAEQAKLEELQARLAEEGMDLECELSQYRKLQAEAAQEKSQLEARIAELKYSVKSVDEMCGKLSAEAQAVEGRITGYQRRMQESAVENDKELRAIQGRVDAAREAIQRMQGELDALVSQREGLVKEVVSERDIVAKVEAVREAYDAGRIVATDVLGDGAATEVEPELLEKPLAAIREREEKLITECKREASIKLATLDADMAKCDREMQALFEDSDRRNEELRTLQAMLQKETGTA